MAAIVTVPDGAQVAIIDENHFGLRRARNRFDKRPEVTFGRRVHGETIEFGIDTQRFDSTLVAAT